MTEQKQLWDWKKSDGGHYSKPVPVIKGFGMEALRTMFPSGKADEMNFVLFSTSGVQGSYTTIEEHEAESFCKSDDGGVQANEITFVIVQPRIVAMRYGKVNPQSPDDYEFLKSLRQSSWDAVARIGKPEAESQ